MKKILITGANSYIGDNVAEYLKEFNSEYSVSVKDTIGWNPVADDFKDIDVVFNVAGIAHIKETDENRDLYYKVNRDLSIAIAVAAKEAGVKQYILLSTMSVYGMNVGYISKDTKPNPVNAYGKSKLEADRAINMLSKESGGSFKFCCLRPPMVYGKDCKGNYQSLRSFALKSPVFPDYQNRRSMLYIGNLCWFVKDCIDRERHGLFFPQNAEYIRTSEMVKLIAEENGKNIRLTKVFNPAILIAGRANVIKKVFGSLTYEMTDPVDNSCFTDSIKNTERNSIKELKALCLASMASNLDNFNRNNVKILQGIGYDVTLASNFHTSEDINSQEKIDSFIAEMNADGVHTVQVDFSRHIGKIKNQIKSYKQVKELLKQGFDLVHCHAPICAAITRLCARKYRKIRGTKVAYTAHGFHFYEGAPAKNWFMFYPVEKWLSKYTDILITINKEDYKRAKEHFYAKKTVYVPGIGVDTEKFGNKNHRNKIRDELGLKEEDIMLLSVGELNENKNHEVVIRALGKMKKDGDLPDNVYYIICGIGDKKIDLENKVESMGLVDRIKLIGFHSNISDYYDAADIFVFPSYREGLSVSLMEAMASGLPVICSKIRGNIDLIDEGKGGFFFEPQCIDQVIKCISKMLSNERNHFGAYNKDKIRIFDVRMVEKKMNEIWRGKT